MKRLLIAVVLLLLFTCTASAYSIQFVANGSLINYTGEIPIQGYVNISGFGNNSAVFSVYVNGTRVPFEKESIVNNNMSFFYSANVTAGADYTLDLYGNVVDGVAESRSSAHGSCNVWDVNFTTVLHMNAVLLNDSTCNNNNGTAISTISIINGSFQQGIDFNGVDNAFTLANAFIMPGAFTTEVFANLDNTVPEYSDDFVGQYVSADDFLNFEFVATNEIGWHVQQTGNSDRRQRTDNNNVVVETDQYYVLSKTGDDDVDVFIDGTEEATRAASTTDDWAADNRIAGRTASGRNHYVDGKIYEIRQSDIKRTAGFITTIDNNFNNPTATDITPFYKSINYLTIDDVIIESWNNNYTNNNALTFSKLIDIDVVNFTVNVTGAHYYNWTVNNIDQTNNYTYFNMAFPSEGVFLVNFTATNITTNFTDGVNWTVTGNAYPMELLTPSNGSTDVAIPTTLTWREWPTTSPHTWQVSTDDQFINIASSGTASSVSESFNASMSLTTGTTYYWRAKNSTGNYSSGFNFTTSATPITNGSLNITVRDEISNTTITTFTTSLYNAVSYQTKNTTTGWTNYTSADVTAGQYLIDANATNYGRRMILGDSPGNYTLYLPSTTNQTVDTIAFYLIDTTGYFPAVGTKIIINRAGLLIQSSYFDADSKSVAQLIRGVPYTISLQYGSKLQQWGNYQAVASGNVQLLVTDIGINQTEMSPLIYTMTSSTSDITLSWNGSGGFQNLSFWIVNGVGETVHSLSTTVKYGQSQYIVTNATDVYYAHFMANTTQGPRTREMVVDLRPGVANMGSGTDTSYGSFTVPNWIYTLASIILIVILAAAWGAEYSAIGAVITSVLSLLLMQIGIMPLSGAGIGFFGGLSVVVILYYVRSTDRSIGMMAYKASLYLIFFNFAVMIIGGAGIIPGHYVDFSGNDCTGDQASSTGCFLARIGQLAPMETANTATSSSSDVLGTITGALNQIGFALVSILGFGLLILTLGYMMALFWFGYWMTTNYLAQLPIPWEWQLALSAGALLIYVTGFMQYKAGLGGSVRDKE